MLALLVAYINVAKLDSARSHSLGDADTLPLIGKLSAVAALGVDEGDDPHVFFVVHDLALESFDVKTVGTRPVMIVSWVTLRLVRVSLADA